MDEWGLGTNGSGIVAAIVYRHVAAFAVVVAVGEELAHEVFEGEASLLEDSSFTVLGECDIVWGQGCSGPNADPFLTGRYLRIC